jgi:hypothetical protein
MTHFWMWTDLKNFSMLDSRFIICELRCRGEPLIWKWIKRIAVLKAIVIVWDVKVADPTNLEICVILNRG